MNPINEQIGHLYRRNAGRMAAVLCRIFGIEKIDLIEDAVQDAMTAALRKWPFSGVPENPTAWLIQTAKNKMLDHLRRERFAAKLDDGKYLIDERAGEREVRFDGELAEDQLRMMFACCHPLISPDSRVALTLKLVSGFSVAEIARAYLAKEDSVAKMLTRSRAKLKSGEIPLTIPAGDELMPRRDAVLRVLYLMFNEGYSATAGDELIRNDLCRESIRLVCIAADHPVTSAPKADALAALFLFQAARLDSRIGSGGELILMADQDRSKWNREMLAAGLERFRRSIAGDELSDYHVEAEIASLHALAPDFAATNWNRMIECYDLLLARRYSPVVDLNRIVAVGHAEGPQAALNGLSRLAENYLMTSFNLFHITRAYFLSAANDTKGAANAYKKALGLTTNSAVRRFIEQKMAAL